MRKLTLLPVVYDIVLKNGDVVATVTRTGNAWIFRDLEANWSEESLRTMEVDELLTEYLDIRKRIRKAKASSIPPDQSQGRPPGR